MKLTEDQLAEKIEALSELIGSDDPQAWEAWAEENQTESEQLYGNEDENSEYGKIEDAQFVASEKLYCPVCGASEKGATTGRDVTLYTLTDSTDYVVIVAVNIGAIGNDQNCNIWLIDSDTLPERRGVNSGAFE